MTLTRPLAPVAKLLRKRRQDRGMTQEDLARKAGVSLPTIARYETGRGVPRIENATRIGAVLGLSAEEIFEATMNGAER